ncbi:MAG: ATP-dependent sacrificial sulfur transferase LarE [Clostridia bacterium]|nr:ATP-dependent sacrificial sulfur transferase LarE [Clostridia bacterium]
MDRLHRKYDILKEDLISMKSAAVAFSGGVDSTFLLKAAHDVLGENVTAITVRSPLFPARETGGSASFCSREGIKQIIIDVDSLKIPGFKDNPPDRCYICKRELFIRMKDEAAKLGTTNVLEGSNTDDEGDYRPGRAAVKELGVKSPLLDAGLSKGEIRALSKELGLETWRKPSFACLASRFVYGETITREKLLKIEEAETFLFERGFTQVRVRMHNDTARIEIDPSEFDKILSRDTAKNIDAFFKSLGFIYVTLDLGGYKTGSMNKTIGI